MTLVWAPNFLISFHTFTADFSLTVLWLNLKRYYFIKYTSFNGARATTVSPFNNCLNLSKMPDSAPDLYIAAEEERMQQRPAKGKHPN
jgi:hypothetical protein